MNQISPTNHIDDLPELPERWQWCRLGDLVDQSRGICYGIVQPGKHDPDGTPMINSGDVISGVTPKEIRFRVSNDIHIRYRRSTIQGGEILLTLVGANFGQVGIAPVETIGYNCSRAVGVIPVTEAPLFVTLCLRGSLCRHFMDNWANTTAQPTFNLKEVANLPIPLPPLDERIGIAHILGTLDDKIELNRKTNETLEAMAKALFKSWFVDFDPVRAKAEGRPTGLPAEISDLFPDSFEDSELGEIPSGWEVRTVEEIAEKVAMGPFGSNIKVSTFVDRGIPVISGQHLKGAILHDGGNNFITPDHADKLKNSCVRRGDIVFTHAGSIGQVSLIPVNSEYQKYVLSQRQFYLRPSSNNLSHYLTMFFRSTNGQHVLLSNASQTGVPSIARPASFLRSIQMLIPRTELLDAFDRQISAMFTKARSITEQNLALLDIRDALLPKLISGKIRIPDAEKMLEEVGV